MTDSYCSPSSVVVKLMNFRSLDQDYGGKGLDGTGGLDRAIWDELSDNPASVGGVFPLDDVAGNHLANAISNAQTR
jgi:hypothetical protein